MSPEYASDGIFSVKSDVFSYGVIILETISGRRNSKIFMLEHGLSLLGHVSISINPYVFIVAHHYMLVPDNSSHIHSVGPFMWTHPRGTQGRGPQTHEY